MVVDSGPDGGNCPPAGECRGFTGNCGDIAKQFENVPIMPLYPYGMADYACTAWPDDAQPVDSFVVGLISIAIAIPVSAFMFSCFQSACASGRACCVLRALTPPPPLLQSPTTARRPSRGCRGTA